MSVRGRIQKSRSKLDTDYQPEIFEVEILLRSRQTYPVSWEELQATILIPIFAVGRIRDVEVAPLVKTVL